MDGRDVSRNDLQGAGEEAMKRMLIALALTAGVSVVAVAQGRGGAAPPPPQSPKDASPVDLTGYWASAITEDWRFRMVTPPKGDVASVPLNADGTKAANAWDPAKDIAGGEQCRAFGAAGIMRLPVRLHITWQDERTLKVEIDNGNQVRLFHFGSSALREPQGRPEPGRGAAGSDAPSLQGVSLSSWETVQQGQGLAPAAGGRGNAAIVPTALTGSLKVVTTKMKPGYLRRNGVPYSGDAVLTEFFDRTNETNGDSWLILTSIVEDPAYLNLPFMLTTHFKRERDGSKFNPRPCEVTPPVVGTGN
jgi:hypothetical protein